MVSGLEAIFINLEYLAVECFVILGLSRMYFYFQWSLSPPFLPLLPSICPSSWTLQPSAPKLFSNFLPYTFFGPKTFYAYLVLCLQDFPKPTFL